MGKVEDILSGSIAREITRASIERTLLQHDDEACLRLFADYANAMYGRFDLDTDNLFVVTNMLKWAFGDTSMRCHAVDGITEVGADITKGLYVYGEAGVGKSTAMDALSSFCNILSTRCGNAYRANGRSIPFSFRCYGSANVCSDYMATGEINTYLRPRIVCYHDLGAEQRETSWMGNKLEVMRHIIELRGDRRDVITCFTSNFRPDDIEEMYGQRAASRIHAMCNFMRIGGKDRRK